MIQKVVKRNPVGELVICVNNTNYLIKVLAGGDRLRTDGIHTRPTAMFAILVSEDYSERQLLVLPYSGHPDDVRIFTFDIGTAEIEVACDIDMTVTVKEK